jgi:hypothetical protein
MFDLERAISEWRQQMRAAGIKAPVPLEELEAHLREEIHWQIKSGIDLEKAFENSVRIIGNAGALKSEFRKIQSTSTSNRILALLWFAGCLLSLNTMRHQFAVNQLREDRHLFFANLLVVLIYCVGVTGSLLLFRGSKFGANIVRAFALLFLIASVAQIFANLFEAPLKWQIWWSACTLFCIVSIWQLHLPKNLKPAV